MWSVMNYFEWSVNTSLLCVQRCLGFANENSLAIKISHSNFTIVLTSDCCIFCWVLYKPGKIDAYYIIILSFVILLK